MMKYEPPPKCTIEVMTFWGNREMFFSKNIHIYQNLPQPIENWGMGMKINSENIEGN